MQQTTLSRREGLMTYCYCFEALLIILLFAFRQHGFDNPREIVGTKGVLKIKLAPRRDLLTIADENGIGNDVSPDFHERCKGAFVKERSVFADCVLDSKELPYELDVAVKGM